MTRLSRRSFLKFAGLGAATLALPRGLRAAESAASATAAPAAKRPNIVLILADDLGYGDVGCQNPKSKIPTPCLDRLASQGVRFTDAHAPSSVCSPTRYAILTGRYAWRNPAVRRSVLWAYDPPAIEPGRLTVAALLKQAGYATACIGKWHLGWRWQTTDGKPAKYDRKTGACNVDHVKPTTDGPTTRGFDSYFGTDVPNFPPYCFIENDRTLGLPTVPKPDAMFGQPGMMLAGWDLVKILPTLTQRAVAHVEQAAKTPDRPFFLYMPLTSPHTPIAPAPEFKGKSGAGDYGDYVCQTDWTVGQVLDAIDRSGLAENTLVLFTSDNGPEYFAYPRIREFCHYSMGDRRGIKSDSWEGGHRVAFMARWPGRIKPATVSAEPICHVDVMATVAALVGLSLPDNAAEDSTNILPAILGEKIDRPLHEAIVHHAPNGSQAIRQGQWVFIDNPTGDTHRPNVGEPAWLKEERGYQPHKFPGELYDLSADPFQRKNLYGERPEIVSNLKALLEKYRAEGRSVPRRK